MHYRDSKKTGYYWLVKKTLNENNKDKGEMAADTLDDLTQSLETNTEYCNLPPSNHIKDSVDLWEYQEEVLTYKSSVKFKKSQWTQLKRNNKGLEEISGPQAKFSEGSKTKSQLRHYNVECDRELYGGRLEDIKQSRERLQREMDYPSCVSSAIRDHEHPTSKLNIQQIQDELLPLKNKLLIQLSKAENERYQLRDSLREKTLMLEITQRKLNQLKDKIKEHEDQIHTENEKLNRSFLRQESIPEVHTHMQSENEFLRKPFKDAPNKGVFKVGTSDCVLMQYKNNLYTDTGELDAAIEEQNKNSAEEYIRLRERLHKLEKEKAERLDTIRKLQQLPDFQKEQFMTSKSKIYEEILKQKQLQKELDESKRNLQESQEEYQQKQKYIKELEDYIQKLNMKHATFEDSVKQHMGKSEKNQKNSLCSPLVEYLKKQLHEITSKNRRLEYMNTKLEEEIMKYDRLDPEHHLERPKLKYNKVEQYRPKIKVQVKQETEEQNDRVNLFLQIQELEAEVLKMQISHQEAKAKLERCKKDFSQEYRFTTNPFVEPLHDLVLDNYMGLSGRNSKYFMGETETSINSMEACFAKMQEELESPVTTIDAELPSTSFWASPMEYTRRPNLN
ncbi:ankyrin repeat domain-containing protein 26-like isoform X2 [Sminthopsis crassicaudata]|uniref:ankyrin repeat domain-containing protein 26-like isoform X2 n=2 Tax=Sminthopsis crassicaudata TaxID=9301 RepID=UPI003D6867F3